MRPKPVLIVDNDHPNTPIMLPLDDPIRIYRAWMGIAAFWGLMGYAAAMGIWDAYAKKPH